MEYKGWATDWEQIDRTAGWILAPVSYKLGSAVVWVLQSGLMDGQDWIQWSVVDGTVN